MKLLHTFVGHSDRVWSLDVHRDLPLVVSTSGDRTALVWNLKTKQQVAVLDEAHKRSVRCAAWKPTGDSPSLALGSFDSTVSIWGYEDGAFTFLATIEGHENEVKGVAWSAQGDFLATCSRDKSVWIWEADDANEEFECISVLQEHTQDVKHVAWHPHELLVASASYDDTLRLWRPDEDQDDWTCVADLKAHASTVWSCCFEPSSSKNKNKSRLVSCSDDGVCIVWTRVSDEADSSSSGPELRPAFRTVLSEEWQVETTLPKTHTRAVYAVDWSPSGRIASVGGDGLLVIYANKSGQWEVESVQKNSHGVREVNAVRWATVDGSELVLTGGDDGVVNVWSD